MLVLSDNSKVRFKGRHYNTFGLSHGSPEDGGTCPGATTGEGGCMAVRDGLSRKTCYVEKLSQIYPAFRKRIFGNTALLAGKTKDEMVEILRGTVESFRKKAGDFKFFRLHMSGDFYSLEYAEAWAQVMRMFPDVRFWAYTRSFAGETNFINPLIGVENLSLYLSCDPVNYEEAYAFYAEHKDKMASLGLSWMGDSPPENPDQRWVKCPAITGKLKTSGDAGACSKCRLCVDRFVNRTKHIQFGIH